MIFVIPGDEQTRTLVIDEDAAPGLQNDVDARTRIYEDYGFFRQMIENRDYAFAILEPGEASYATCMAVDKHFGEAVLDQVPKELAGRSLYSNRSGTTYRDKSRFP